MGRKKGGKRGPPEHFSGHKLRFIESWVPTFLQCPSKAARGEFHTKFTNEFCRKYGDNYTEITVDLAEDAPDPEIFGDDDEVSAKAADEKSSDYKKIRLVRYYN